MLSVANRIDTALQFGFSISRIRIGLLVVIKLLGFLLTPLSMTTRAAARGEPTSVYAKSHAYYNSFLPKTIRDLRIGPQH